MIGDILSTVASMLLLFLLTPIVSAFVMGVGAMMCGLVFEDTIRSVWRTVGVDLDQFSMFQIGVALGFAGGFVKATLTTPVRSR